MYNSLPTVLLRLALELSALIIIIYWGWTLHTGICQILLGGGMPLLATTLWATFRGPGARGLRPIKVPGPLRLLMEVLLLSFASGLLTALGYPFLATIFFMLIMIQYVLSYDRVLALLEAIDSPSA